MSAILLLGQTAHNYIGVFMYNVNVQLSSTNQSRSGMRGRLSFDGRLCNSKLNLGDGELSGTKFGNVLSLI